MVDNKEEIEPKLGDEIPKNWLKESEKEIKSGYRTMVLDEFMDKKNVEIHIHRLTSGDESQAADAYARSFSRLIKDKDLMTQKQMLKLMKEKEIWGDKEEGKFDDLQEQMRDIQLEIAKMRQKGKYNKAQMNRFRTKWKERRRELMGLIEEKTDFLGKTVEGRAGEEEIKVKLSLCVKYPDGKRLWGSLDEINAEYSLVDVQRICNEALLYWAGLTQEIIDSLPTDLLFGGEESDPKNS